MNVRFVLFPASVEFAPMNQVVDFFKVAWDVVVEPNVQTLPTVPVRLNAVNSFVVPAVNRTDVAPVAEYVLVMLANLFEPLIVNWPAPP